MAYTRLQSPAVANGSGSSISKAFAGSTTAHSLMVAFVTTDAATPGTFTYSGGGTWASLGSFKETGGSGQWISIGYCLDATGGSAPTIQASWTGAGTFNGLIITEVSAPGNVASVLDANTTGKEITAGTTSTPTDNSVAASAGDYVVSYMLSAAATTISAGASFTLIQTDTTDVAASEDLINAAGTLSPSFGVTGTPAVAIMSAAFKPAGGAAAVTAAQFVPQLGSLVPPGFMAPMQLARRITWNWAAGGPIVYAQTSTDDTGETDNLTDVAAYVRSQTDDTGLTDVPTRVAASNQTQTDDTGLTDSPSQAAGYVRTNTDSVGLTDNTSQAAAFSQTLTDSAGLTDNIVQAAAYTQTAITDDSGLTDNLTVLKLLAVTITDDSGLTDNSTRVVAASQTATDSSGLTDTSSQVAAYVRTITDDSGLTDVMSQAASGSSAQTVTDSAGLTDSVTQAVNYNITITDSAGLTDLVVKDFARILTDLAGLTDTSAQLYTARPTLTDSAGLTDVVVLGGSAAAGREITIIPDLTATRWGSDLTSVRYGSDVASSRYGGGDVTGTRYSSDQTSTRYGSDLNEQ